MAKIKPRTEYLQVKEPNITEFEVNGWGWCRVASISERERREWDMSNLTKDGDVDLSKVPTAGARLMVATMLTDNNEKLFRPADVEQLSEVDCRVIGEIVDRIRKHCGIDQTDIDVAVKNSNETTTDSSP